MLLILPDVLDGAALDALSAELDGATFEPGAATARGPSGKHNLQLRAEAPGADRAGKRVLDALLGHRTLRDAVLPRSVRHPIIARYEPGMAYPPHLDSPLMTAGVSTRVDVACTLFLSAPEDYDGGELVVDVDGAAQGLKGARGSAVLYSADTRHEVRPVTRGVRLVAVTWLQSLVRSAEQRRILWDLRQGLEGAARVMAPGEARELALLRLQGAYDNLLRAWLEA